MKGWNLPNPYLEGLKKSNIDLIILLPDVLLVGGLDYMKLNKNPQGACLS